MVSRLAPKGIYRGEQTCLYIDEYRYNATAWLVRESVHVMP